MKHFPAESTSISVASPRAILDSELKLCKFYSPMRFGGSQFRCSLQVGNWLVVCLYDKVSP